MLSSYPISCLTAAVSAGGHHWPNPFPYTSGILCILWRLQQISSWTNNSGETILHLVIWFILVIITGLDYNFYHLEFNLLHRQLKPDNSHIKLWIMIFPGIKFLSLTPKGYGIKTTSTIKCTGKYVVHNFSYLFYLLIINDNSGPKR